MREKPIAFYAEIARELGSIGAAIFYQQIRYWSDKGSREDGWIYKTTEEIEKETTIQRKSQEGCRKILEEKGWLEAKKIMHRGSMVWHYRLLVDFKFEMHQVAKRTVDQVSVGTVATGPKDTSTTGPKASSSITETTSENTQSEKKNFSRPDLQGLSEKLPNTALGSVPEINHRPPMEIKEEKRLQRRLAGMYTDSFGSTAIRIVKHFCELYEAKYASPYGAIVKVDVVAKNISTYFKNGEDEESLTTMLDCYFASEKADALPVKLTTAFSEDTYRAWKQGKLAPDGKEASVYPMNVEGLILRSDADLQRAFDAGLVYQVEGSKWALTPNGKGVKNI